MVLLVDQGFVELGAPLAEYRVVASVSISVLFSGRNFSWTPSNATLSWRRSPFLTREALLDNVGGDRG